MSGRGRGRGASNVSIVASSLGIARHEIAAYTRVNTEAPALYPALIPLPTSTENTYMAEVKHELLTRFHESSFYLEDDEGTNRVHRYTDKYKAHLDKDPLRPDWSRLPDELCWVKKLSTEDKQRRKKRKLDVNDKNVSEKLSKLEEKEAVESAAEEEEVEDEEEERDEEAEVGSDEDFLEEDNDYVHNYFDNGENYGEGGSDDNLDEFDS